MKRAWVAKPLRGRTQHNAHVPNCQPGMCDVPHIRLYHIRLSSGLRAAETTAIKSPAAGQLKDERGVIIVLRKPGDMAIDAD